MREFVFGTDEQYQMLKDMLTDGRCHVFPRCLFPASFSKPGGRMGFEYSQSRRAYILYIDRGISCTKSPCPEILKDWLRTGELRFLDYTDMKEFLRSLQILY